MEKKGRSVTAEAVAIQQTLHQTLDAPPKILDDPISPRLIDPASETYKAVAAYFESVTREVNVAVVRGRSGRGNAGRGCARASG